MRLGESAAGSVLLYFFFLFLSLFSFILVYIFPNSLDDCKKHGQLLENNISLTPHSSPLRREQVIPFKPAAMSPPKSKSILSLPRFD